MFSQHCFDRSNEVLTICLCKTVEHLRGHCRWRFSEQRAPRIGKFDPHYAPVTLIRRTLDQALGFQGKYCLRNAALRLSEPGCQPLGSAGKPIGVSKKLERLPLHWLQAVGVAVCGKVQDIAPGTKPRLPKTWPGVPLLLDSPGWQPSLTVDTVEVRVPFDDIGIVNRASFDCVTAGLRINASVHAPLLCVTDMFKIASGNLSLPGKTNQ